MLFLWNFLCADDMLIRNRLECMLPIRRETAAAVLLRSSLLVLSFGLAILIGKVVGESVVTSLMRRYPVWVIRTNPEPCRIQLLSSSTAQGRFGEIIIGIGRLSAVKWINCPSHWTGFPAFEYQP